MSGDGGDEASAQGRWKSSMRLFGHPARRHLHERLGADYTRASMPFLIAICVVALILIFLPEVVMLVPDLIFGKK
jgi:hypothetical protein